MIDGMGLTPQDFKRGGLARCNDLMTCLELIAMYERQIVRREGEIAELDRTMMQLWCDRVPLVLDTLRAARSPDVKTFIVEYAEMLVPGAITELANGGDRWG